MKSMFNTPGRIALALALVGLSAGRAFATLSFYAPYDSNFTLTAGSPSTPGSTNGTITFVPGFTNWTFNAAHFNSGTSNGLTYGRVDSYLTGVGNGALIGSNSFRLLYKPDYSGVQGHFTLRRTFLGGGFLSSDGFYLAQSDDAAGPGLRVAVGGTPFDNMISNFSWNSSTWYYIGASIDSQGSIFFIRALTNNSPTFTRTMSFGVKTNWGSGFMDALPLHVGGIATCCGPPVDGAQGSLDRVQILRGEKLSLGDFQYDYAFIIPEPSSVPLLWGAGLVTIALRKCHRRA